MLVRNVVQMIIKNYSGKSFCEDVETTSVTYVVGFTSYCTSIASEEQCSSSRYNDNGDSVSTAS